MFTNVTVILVVKRKTALKNKNTIYLDAKSYRILSTEISP